ncbi:serine/threonine-protein kinase [Nonomuraea sp. NPDC001023]|uniref:serine/threonine-protein kinase n=1 Tax=unclassified Nonomuraea TaxID=2593643 RepID=UPI00332D53FC
MKFKAGETIGGRFRLVRELGKGGIGRVWLAQEKRLDRLVAVKVLLDLDGQDSDEDRWKKGELLKRFAVEARAVAGLDHPGIPAVYDWSSGDPETGEPPYLAMQYVVGKTLQAVLEEEVGGRLTVVEAVCLGAQLSSSLAAMHGAGGGILHRDLKPGNIMVTDGGRVSLIDFGSAFIMDPHQPRVTTRSRIAPGTSGYTAPEVLEGRTGPAALSDLYALGCIIYEALAGPVFVYENDSDLDQAHRKEKPPSLKARNSAVPEEINRLVMRLLEKQPAQRPGSAHEVFAHLRSLLPGPVPEGIERVRPYDLTLPFRDPCRPPEDIAGTSRDRTLPPVTVGAVRVEPTAFIENLRNVSDLLKAGRQEEGWGLIKRMLAMVEAAQGVAGTDVRRLLARGIRIFLESDDFDHAKLLWEDMITRCRGNGIARDDSFLEEARAAFRTYNNGSGRRRSR